jgi:hypothetical protein
MNISIDDILGGDYFKEMFQYFEFKDIINLLKACRSVRTINTIYNNYIPSFEFNLYNNVLTIKADKTYVEYHSLDIIKKWRKGINHLLLYYKCLEYNYNLIDDIKILKITLFSNSIIDKYFNLNNRSLSLINNLILSKYGGVFNLIYLQKFKNLECLQFNNYKKIILTLDNSDNDIDENYEHIRFDNIKSLIFIGDNLKYNYNMLKIFPNLEKLVFINEIKYFSYIPNSLYHLSIINCYNLNLHNNLNIKLANNIKSLYFKQYHHQQNYNYSYSEYVNYNCPYSIECNEDQNFTLFSNLEKLICKYYTFTFTDFKIPKCLIKLNIQINNDKFVITDLMKEFCKLSLKKINLKIDNDNFVLAYFIKEYFKLIKHKNLQFNFSYKSGNKIKNYKI